MLERILRFFVGRATVTNRAVQASTDALAEILAQKGFSQTEQIPRAVRMIIIQEALRKAAEKETDRCARMGEFLDEIHLAADSIIAAFNKDENADVRIKSILAFHKLL